MPLLDGIPDGHVGVPYRGPHLCTRTSAVTFSMATSVSGAPRVHLVSALSGWLPREFFSALQCPSLSESAGSASGQISRLLEVSGETEATVARDLWVLIETNQENRGFKRAFFFFFLSNSHCY